MRLIIKECFGDETRKLCEALEANDVRYKFREHTLYREADDILRGPINFVKQYQKIYDANVVDFDKFKCSNYYHYFGDLMFNAEHIFMTKAALYKNKRMIPWMTWNDQSLKVFIRPDSGCKEFTGTTIGFKWYGKDLDIVLADVPAETLCLISSVKATPEEYRAVIGPEGLVSISKESFNGERITSRFYSKILDFAKSFTFPKIQDFYTIDFCEMDDKLKIMECNSFNCAGLYSVNYDKVVKSLKEFYK